MSHLPSWLYWAVVICICLLAAPLCLAVILELTLIWLYGIEVLWRGIPEAIERGPADGLAVLFAFPVAGTAWLLTALWIVRVALQRRTQAMPTSAAS